MNKPEQCRVVARRVSPARCLLLVAAVVAILCGVNSPAGASQDTVIRLGDDIVIEDGITVGGVVSVGGNIKVYGHVRKNVVAAGGAIFLGERAVIGGDVISVGGPVVKQEGAQVSGDITVVDTSRITSVFSRLAAVDFPEIPGFFPFVGFLLITVCIVALIPSTVGFISFNLEHDTLKAFAWGVLGTVLILPTTIMFIISIVGIVLIPVLMILVGCAFLLGYVATSQLVGKKITIAVKKPGRPILQETLLGVVVLWGMGLVPLLGWLIQMLAAVLGFGGVICSIFARRKRA